MSVLEDIAKYYLDRGEVMPADVFLVWLKYTFELEQALYKKELELCDTPDKMKWVKNKYTGKDSTLRKVIRALADWETK